MKLKTICLISIFLFSVLFVSLANAASEYGQDGYGAGIYGSAASSGDETPGDESNSADSGSGGGGRMYPSFSSSQDELNEGYTMIMLKNWKISFKIGDETHAFKVEDITETAVKISISSETQEATLLIGEEKKFDVYGDNDYDVLARLNSIDSANKLRPRANLTIQSIGGEITSQQKRSEGEETQDIAAQQESESDKYTEESPGIVTGKGRKDESGRSTANLAWLFILIAGIVVLILLGIGYKKLRPKADTSIKTIYKKIDSQQEGEKIQENLETGKDTEESPKMEAEKDAEESPNEEDQQQIQRGSLF